MEEKWSKDADGSSESISQHLCPLSPFFFSLLDVTVGLSLESSFILSSVRIMRPGDEECHAVRQWVVWVGSLALCFLRESLFLESLDYTLMLAT